MRTRTAGRFLRKSLKKWGDKVVMRVVLRNENVIHGFVNGPYYDVGPIIQIHDGSMKPWAGGNILVRDIIKIEESTPETMIKSYWELVLLCRKAYESGKEVAKILPFFEK